MLTHQLEPGQLVTVRSRQYLVEESILAPEPLGDTIVRLACLEDDAQGELLEVLWEREIDAKVIGSSQWQSVAQQGFDIPKTFGAFLNAQRWNLVTSTDAELFQAPYRAGIQVKAYQLEPLRKALGMPRVNLFIADDVGLGKTIEAGLIVREMLLRQKVKRIVVAAPPSVVRQWQDEMQERFGLSFTVIDRGYLARCRQERGYSNNPWTAHTRFIISHALLRDEAYAAPLRDWLGDFSLGAMLILDEAHNAAPASSSKYAVDSQFTKVVRDIAPRFEHKLFLSATPHNGHSNSFAALLEMLDPQRFCRGVPIAGASGRKLLESVMVRRLKQDIRELGGNDFPKRQVIPLHIGNLPEDAPELLLSRLLQRYRILRNERLKQATRSSRRAAMLVVISLQKRLLSSVEAFARTLKVHRDAFERQGGRSRQAALTEEECDLLGNPPNADDDRADLSEADVETEADLQMARASQDGDRPSNEELALLDEMAAVASSARSQLDSKLRVLIDWIRDNLCPNLGQPDAQWRNRRVLIFTEYADTKRYLEQQLNAAIAGSRLAERRIGTFHGGMGDDKREDIKQAFNADPTQHPLRILIATDAAREGVNLQNHCSDLFHYDVPWNPSRMEQRNGRIDRKLQREPEVRCHYFVLTQRTEDRVLRALVTKTETIQKELGSLSPVIGFNLSERLRDGIDDRGAEQMAYEIEGYEVADTVKEELETVRPEVKKLLEQEEKLQQILQKSKDWLQLDDRQFRETLSAALEVLGAPGLVETDSEGHRWAFPALDRLPGADASWGETLDSLRSLRQPKQKLWEWRKDSPIRPVVFADPGTLDGEVVHLHLEHRLVQRLLGRFRTQGFIHHELSRACVCRTKDAIPKVLVLGRLSLYGQGASRLHDEIVTIAAEWRDPDLRGEGALRPLDTAATEKAVAELNEALVTPRLQVKADNPLQARLRSYAERDIQDLLVHLDATAKERREAATQALKERGKKEADSLRGLLQRQRERIDAQYQEQDLPAKQLELNLQEFQQLKADRSYWERRLRQLEAEIAEEPKKIKQLYAVKAHRIDPIGIAYLWPISS